MTDQQIDEFLEMLAKSPTSARDMVRGLFAAHEAKAAPAVPQGWKPVPLEPTEEMVNASNKARVYREDGDIAVSSVLAARTYNTKQAWAAMLAAAPSQPAVPEIDYPELIRAAYATDKKWAQGTNGCSAFARGAEWFRAQMLAAPSQPVTCGNGCSCLVQCGDTYAHAGLPIPKEPVTLTDSYAGVIAWIGDKQCKRVLTEGAIKHEHTPGVAMRNTAHQCVQEVIIAALREKEQTK